ncbi:MAG: hypothetical protein H6640_18395 [Caldilineaceae bacterium]|nr:hypothetical protein [Caldilineaceae bacterium]
MTVAGILLSGPIGLLAVTIVHPSPPWLDAASYAQFFHPIQTAPFFGGFFLVGGYVVMIAALYELADEQQKTNALIAVTFTAIFATLIFFNYINQTTFIPALVQGYRPEYDSAISTFSLANPLSLCWAIEMWGYALLGVATWLTASIFNRNRIEKITAALMIANGVVSIVGGIVTAWNLGWVLTTPGVVSYVGWNALVLALSIFVILSLRKRQTVAGGA